MSQTTFYLEARDQKTARQNFLVGFLQLKTKFSIRLDGTAFAVTGDCGGIDIRVAFCCLFLGVVCPSPAFLSLAKTGKCRIVGGFLPASPDKGPERFGEIFWEEIGGSKTGSEMTGELDDIKKYEALDPFAPPAIESGIKLPELPTLTEDPQNAK